MDGNVDPEGIRLDLEWLHRVGVRGVQMFDGGMGTPLVVPERVSPGSPAWRAAVEQATSIARRLGLEFAVATSAGWSAAGGPWVEPADAMKKVVWSETRVTGRPSRRGAAGARCPTSPGPTRTARGAGRLRGSPRTGSRWPCRPTSVPPVLVPGAVTASAPDRRLGFAGGRRARRHGRPSRGTPTGPRRPGWSRSSTSPSPSVRSPWASPVRAASAPHPRRTRCWRRATTACTAGWWPRLPQLVVPAGKAVPVRTVAFPPVTARRFRLVLTGQSAADALPRLADGVAPPPVLRRADRFLVSEFALARRRAGAPRPVEGRLRGRTGLRRARRHHRARRRSTRRVWST